MKESSVGGHVGGTWNKYLVDRVVVRRRVSSSLRTSKPDNKTRVDGSTGADSFMLTKYLRLP